MGTLLSGVDAQVQMDYAQDNERGYTCRECPLLQDFDGCISAILSRTKYESDEQIGHDIANATDTVSIRTIRSQLFGLARDRFLEQTVDADGTSALPDGFSLAVRRGKHAKRMKALDIVCLFKYASCITTQFPSNTLKNPISSHKNDSDAQQPPPRPVTQPGITIQFPSTSLKNPISSDKNDSDAQEPPPRPVTIPPIVENTTEDNTYNHELFMVMVQRCLDYDRAILDMRQNIDNLELEILSIKETQNPTADTSVVSFSDISTAFDSLAADSESTRIPAGLPGSLPADSESNHTAAHRTEPLHSNSVSTQSDSEINWTIHTQPHALSTHDAASVAPAQNHVDSKLSADGSNPSHRTNTAPHAHSPTPDDKLLSELIGEALSPDALPAHDAPSVSPAQNHLGSGLSADGSTPEHPPNTAPHSTSATHGVVTPSSTRPHSITLDKPLSNPISDADTKNPTATMHDVHREINIIHKLHTEYMETVLTSIEGRTSQNENCISDLTERTIELETRSRSPNDNCMRNVSIDANNDVTLEYSVPTQNSFSELTDNDSCFITEPDSRSDTSHPTNVHSKSKSKSNSKRIKPKKGVVSTKAKKVQTSRAPSKSKSNAKPPKADLPEIRVPIFGSSLVRDMGEHVDDRTRNIRASSYPNPGYTAEELTPILKHVTSDKDDVLVIFGGTNNIPRDSVSTCIRKIDNLISEAIRLRPNKAILMSEIAKRYDGDYMYKIEEINDYIHHTSAKHQNLHVLEHGDLCRSDFTRRGLHFSAEGKAKIGNHIRNAVESIMSR